MNAINRNRTQSETGMGQGMNVTKGWIVIAVTLFLIGRGFVSELLAADAISTNVTVEVLIYSGRQNPIWQLQDTKPLEDLKAKLNELPQAFEEQPRDWSRLGFTGFRLRGGQSLGLPEEIRVYQGTIKIGRGKAAKYLKDATGLEQYLIQQAMQQASETHVKKAVENYAHSRKSAP